jgi:MGT family glycosyltransferase
MSTGSHILVATWDGGGTAPPELAVVRALVERGHTVTVLADAVLADDVAATGAQHVAWTSAPQHMTRLREDDFIKDWEVKNPMQVFSRVRDRFICGPAALFADDMLKELVRQPADLVVTSQMMLGAQIAAESVGVPVVSLCANVLALPGTGQPPFGTGFKPARSVLGRLRDRAIGKVMERMFDGGRDAINAVRTSHHLAPVAHTLDQMRQQETLLLIDQSFDFPATFPPNVHYAGAQLDDPPWTDTWAPPAGDDPLVLVAMSSTYMRQDEVLNRVAAALGSVPVRAVLTTGLAVSPDEITAPPNVTVVRSAPHSEVLRHAAAVVTHGGHGTVAKTLAAGVPLLVMPMGRDQPDNAARVVAHGAGLRLAPKASPAAIAKAVGRLLHEPGFRTAAERVGEKIRATAGPRVAVELIERKLDRSVKNH